MLNFTFHNPTCIYFGKGRIKELAGELEKRAKKVLVVTGAASVKKNGIFDAVAAEISKAGIEYCELTGICPNPRLESVYEGIEICRNEGVDFVLPVGGGSVIDAAKCVAAGAGYPGDVWDFFATDIMPEDVLPIGTVLTLAATGSEMNTNAVISREDTKRKLSLSAPVLRPVFSILDPEYTYTVNKYHTAAGVADIMAHVFEYYLSPGPDAELQDALAEAILKICVRFGPVACENPRDYNARANLMWASTLALNGLLGRGKASDWTLHAIEHEISAIYDISHGAGLAVILPAYMKMVLGKYGSDKFGEYGINIWGIDRNMPVRSIGTEAICRTIEFFNSMGLPSRLKEMRISDENISKIAKNVMSERRKTESFEQFTKDDIHKMLEMSL